MSGMGYGACTSVNNWMVPGTTDQWTKLSAEGAASVTRRNICENVSTTNATEMYEHGVISSSSPPGSVMAAENRQSQDSRLRTLLTQAKGGCAAVTSTATATLTNARPARHTRKPGILKGLLKGQPERAKNDANPDRNFVLKGLLNSGVTHQDNHLLNSLGFSNVQSPPSSSIQNCPQAVQSPSFSQNSPLAQKSPPSYNSPSPTGSSKRGADDDIYIEHQVIKKCYVPPSFRSLPSSSAPETTRDNNNSKALYEKNKMLASLLATEAPLGPIPQVPEEIITATPNPRPSGRVKKNSANAFHGGSVELNTTVTPTATSPNLPEYKPPVTKVTLRELQIEVQQEAYPVKSQARTPATIASSPESESCYPTTESRIIQNQVVDRGSTPAPTNQQRLYPCNQQETWQNYCGRQDEVASTSSTCAQDNGAWNKQIAAHRKMSLQSREVAPRVSCNNNYNTLSTSEYNFNYYSCDYYNEFQMRQGQVNYNVQQYFMQQQQLLMQQQQLNEQSYQQCYQASTMQNQQLQNQQLQQQQLQQQQLQQQQFLQQRQLQQQQMPGWSGYSRETQAGSALPYNCFQWPKQNDPLKQNFRGTNYQESVNYQENWDLQNPVPESCSRIPNVLEYNQNRGLTSNEQKYTRKDTVDSNALLELPYRLSDNENVPPNCHRVKPSAITDLQQMPQSNTDLMIKDDDLPILGTKEIDDLSRILEDVLDYENPDKQKDNPLPIPNGGSTVLPNTFLYNNCNNYDAQSCV